MILLYSWDGDPVLNLDSLTHVDHLLTVPNSGLTSLFSKTLPSYGSYLHCTHNYSQPNNNFFFPIQNQLSLDSLPSLLIPKQILGTFMKMQFMSHENNQKCTSLSFRENKIH